LSTKAFAALAILCVLLFSGCTSSDSDAPAEDPCIAIRASAEEAFEPLREMDLGSSMAKVQLLSWAYLVTGDSQCFSVELVAQARTAIRLAN
jgi:hypothetical protein